MSDFKVTDEDLKEAISKALNGQKYNLYGLSAEDLHTALIALTNHLNSDEIFNANVLISAEDINAANAYGNILAEALKSIFNKDMCASPIEDNLYDWENLREKNRDINALLVENAKIQDPEQLFETLTEFEKKGFNPAVIICTDNETVERLKQFDKMDYRLYHYLCGSTKIFVPGINKDNIAESAFKELEKKGLELTDVFKEKTKIYVEAVYPEASLTKEPFLEDLITRIITERNKKTVELNKILDETDVPFSEKAEKLWEIRQNKKEEEKEELELKREMPFVETAGQGEKDKSPNEVSEQIESDENTSTKEENSIEDLNDDSQTNGQIHQVLLMAMSTLPAQYKKGNVYVLEENKFKKPYAKHKSIIECKPNEIIDDCFGQMEPVPKMMLEKIDKFSIVDFIIVSTDATTKRNCNIIEARNEGSEFSGVLIKSPTDYFIHNIMRFLNKNKETYHKVEEKKFSDYTRIVYSDDAKKIRFNIVNVDENKPLEGLEKTVNTIRTIYKDTEEDIKLWVDSHGGYRDINLMIASLLSILKNENIIPQKKYGIHFSDENDIFEQNEMFGMFDFVTGMNDFFKYGHSKVLEEMFLLEDDENKDSFVEGMKLIDEGIQFSNSEVYRQGINKIKKEINKSSKNTLINIFRESIKKDFGELILSNGEAGELLLIKRCVDKNFIQQALTFLENNMWRDFEKNKIIEFQDEKLKEFYDENKNEKGELDVKKFDGNLNLCVGKSYGDIIKSMKKSLFDLLTIKHEKLDGTNSDEIRDRIKNKKVKSLRLMQLAYDSNNDNELGGLLCLHKYLKGCRNDLNHAANKRPKIEYIRNAIYVYIELFNSISEKLKIVSETDKSET